MGVFRLVATAVLVAAAVAATHFIDERFEGSVPPPGWTESCSRGDWTSGTGGPWGNFADGFANPQYPYFGQAEMDSPPMAIGSGKTAYYRFYCRSGASGNAGGFGWYFYLYYRDNPGSPFVTVNLRENSAWHERTGSANVARSEPVVARWRVHGGALMPPGSAYIYLNVDTAQISDLPLTAVAPASLGRVRALFR